METMTCTKQEFELKVSEYWTNVFKAFDEMPEEEAAAYKASEYQKLMQYEIVLCVEPALHNEALVQLIKRYCVDQHLKNEDCLIYTGSAGSAFDSRTTDDFYRPNITVPPKFAYVPQWSGSSRECFVSYDDLAMITICEGDLSICLYLNKEAFYTGYHEATVYYDSQ